MLVFVEAFPLVSPAVFITYVHYACLSASFSWTPRAESKVGGDCDPNLVLPASSSVIALR